MFSLKTSVIVIDNSVGLTGALKAIVAKTDLLKDSFNFIYVVPNGGSNIEFLENSGYQFECIDFLEVNKSIKNILLYPLFLVINSAKLSKIAKKFNVTIVHVNDMYNMVGILGKLFAKYKCVTHIRRMPESFPRVLYYIWSLLNVKFSDKILSVSNANARYIRDKFPSYQNIQTVYDPIDMGVFGNHKYKFQDNSNILYLANYNLGKGQNHAVEIVNRIVNHLKLNHKFKIWFYGDDFGNNNNIQFKKNLIKNANRLNINEYFVFGDKVDDVFLTMSRFDFALNLSDSESLSRVTLESLIFGIPIIATDVGGTSEMLSNNQNGILVAPKNIEEMTTAFLELLAKRDSLLRMSNKQEMIVDKFNPTAISNKLKAIYLTILSENE